MQPTSKTLLPPSRPNVASPRNLDIPRSHGSAKSLEKTGSTSLAAVHQAKQHDCKKVFLNKPSNCHVCKSFIWGLTKCMPFFFLRSSKLYFCVFNKKMRKFLLLL